MSLSRRLVLTVVGLVAVVSLLVAATATLVMRGYLTDRLDDELAQAMDRASDEVGGGGPFQPGGPGQDLDLCGEPPPLPRGQSAGSITAVHTQDCRRGLQITQSAQLRELSSTALDTLDEVEPDERPRTVELATLGDFRVAATTTSDGTVVVQGLPTDGVDATIVNLVRAEVLLALAGVVAAGVVGRVLVLRQLRPLREVAATAHEVTTLPLDSGEVGRTVRVPPEHTDARTEVGQVGEALNALLRHVEGALDARHESEQQVRRFLADASHELRTPLSTIRGYAELGRRTGTDQLAKVESEAERMSSLVEDMLLLARLDAGRPLEQADVDLARLVVEAVDDARVVDPRRTWRLDVPETSVHVTGDASRLHQALTNLLTNAARHTPPGTVVTARLAVDPDVVRIDVHDDGPGLGDGLADVVFDRFARGDSSRTRASGGAGLGTAIVRAVAEAHGGSVTVRSSPGDTTFSVLLPRSR